MNRLPNAWKPMLLGAILMLVLVGVAGAVPTDRPHVLSTRRQIMISASDFYPNASGYAYTSTGHLLYTTSSNGCFMAPVDFPYPLWVTIDKFELFAYDNDSGAEITAELMLSSPASFTAQPIGYVATGGSYASSTPGTWQDTSISPNVKNPANDVYVYACIGNPSNLILYGVRIFYYMGR